MYTTVKKSASKMTVSSETNLQPPTSSTPSGYDTASMTSSRTSFYDGMHDPDLPGGRSYLKRLGTKLFTKNKGPESSASTSHFDSSAPIMDEQELEGHADMLTFRMDYVLQEGMAESKLGYGALTSHSSYWRNQDLAYFVTKVLNNQDPSEVLASQNLPLPKLPAVGGEKFVAVRKTLSSPKSVALALPKSPSILRPKSQNLSQPKSPNLSQPKSPNLSQPKSPNLSQSKP